MPNHTRPSGLLQRYREEHQARHYARRKDRRTMLSSRLAEKLQCHL